MSIIIGMIGGLLIVAAFIAGVLLSARLRKPEPHTVSVVAPSVSDELDGMTPEEIQKYRAGLRATQKAFEATQNYSAEMAYGMNRDDLARTLGG